MAGLQLDASDGLLRIVFARWQGKPGGKFHDSRQGVVMAMAGQDAGPAD